MTLAASANDLVLTERNYRETSLGRALQIKIHAPGYRALSWRDVWERFAEAFPGKWAVQVFPPAEELVDGKNVYHLFVLDRAPEGLNIR
jgi:hypothetical protein